MRIERANERGEAPQPLQRVEEGRGGQKLAGGDPLAQGLGWASLGLGLAALAATPGIARMIGVTDNRDNRAVLRAVGVREIASGIGILAQSRPTGMLWARVAGDVMDLLLLGAALRSPQSRRGRVAVATAAVAGLTALDVASSTRLMRGPSHVQRPLGRRMPARRRATLTRSITVNRPVEEVYAFWRDLEHLPRFMRHLHSVQVIDERRSHWKAKGPAGRLLEWDAEIVEDLPNERIAWRSLRADIGNAGAVTFRPAPGNRGTEVRVHVEHAAPGGPVTTNVAKLFRQSPEQKVQDDLRAFKQVMETGEVVRSDASLVRGRHAAQPLPVPRHTVEGDERGR
jgi:uncharacterized membrane protein